MAPALARRLVPLLALATLSGLAACGATAAATRASADAAFAAGSGAHLVPAAELSQTREASAYDAIARARPELLRARSTRYSSSLGDEAPAVYLDGTRQAGLDALRTIPARMVKEVRYLSEVEANLRFTGGHPAGAVLVRTK